MNPTWHSTITLMHPNGFGFVRVRQLESLQYQVNVALGGGGGRGRRSSAKGQRGRRQGGGGGSLCIVLSYCWITFFIINSRKLSSFPINYTYELYIEILLQL